MITGVGKWRRDLFNGSLANTEYSAGEGKGMTKVRAFP